MITRTLLRTTLAAIVVTALTACGAEAEPTATVLEVVDGDTVEVERDGETLQVHLRHVDAPAADDACLGAEAGTVLRDLLPAGTVVRLESAVEDGDAWSAGVYADDVLVNAEVARHGAGHAVDEGDDDLADAVLAAAQEAQDAGAGLHDATVACTLPGQVAAFEQAGEQAVTAAAALAVGVGLEEVDRHTAALDAAETAGRALLTALDDATGPAGRYGDDVRDALRERVTDQQTRTTAAVGVARDLRTSETQRIEAEQAAAAEAARLAAEQAAAAEAARVAEAERQAEAARRAEADRQAAASRAATLVPPAASSGGAASGSVSYANCDAVRAAGAAPLYAGQPGYSGKLDRDKDGVACE